ncbi:hypothetical protein PGT21_018593 [Puccinia graminis f. sp. tritici]|uniref:Uncharacterized protein n=1 Tax=Puccinia graminis f. sp. tritici TaxID=56615 RepID=A0A5B0PS69_PUCGR|nr:hypothetical protein PGT21_018593 [Puccinia graminis f. sp. tritici]
MLKISLQLLLLVLVGKCSTMNEHEFDPSKSLSLSEIFSELLAVGKWSNKMMTGPHELKKLPGSSDNKNVFLDGRNHNQKVSNHKEYKDAIYHDQEISDFERNKVHKEKDEVYQNPEISDFEMNNLPKQEMVRDASVVPVHEPGAAPPGDIRSSTAL